MPTKWVLALRRIGWAITFPLVALIVLAFYGSTKNCEIEVPGVGTLFSGTVSAGVWDALDALKASTSKEEFKAKLSKLPLPEGIKANLLEEGGSFIVHERTSKFKLIGLVVGSLAAVALIIEGSVSICARVGRRLRVKGL
jgi:hypothetical protein